MHQRYDDQYEETFRQEPQLISPYQELAPSPYPELPLQAYRPEAGQKLVDDGIKTSKPRFLLPVILSTIFVFVLYALAFLNPGPGTMLAIAICSTIIVAFLNGFLIARRR